MTERKSQIESLRMNISYEFKRRHYFKGGRFTPLDNVREYISTLRRLERGGA